MRKRNDEGWSCTKALPAFLEMERQKRDAGAAHMWFRARGFSVRLVVAGELTRVLDVQKEGYTARCWLPNTSDWKILLPVLRTFSKIWPEIKHKGA